MRGLLAEKDSSFSLAVAFCILVATAAVPEHAHPRPQSMSAA